MRPNNNDEELETKKNDCTEDPVRAMVDESNPDG